MGLSDFSSATILVYLCSDNVVLSDANEKLSIEVDFPVFHNSICG
jgi:hypothetical protein